MAARCFPNGNNVFQDGSISGAGLLLMTEKINDKITGKRSVQWHFLFFFVTGQLLGAQWIAFYNSEKTNEKITGGLSARRRLLQKSIELERRTVFERIVIRSGIGYFLMVEDMEEGIAEKQIRNV